MDIKTEMSMPSKEKIAYDKQIQKQIVHSLPLKKTVKIIK